MDLRSHPIGVISQSSITSVHNGFTMALDHYDGKDLPPYLTIYRIAKPIAKHYHQGGTGILELFLFLECSYQKITILLEKFQRLKF